MLIDDLNVSLLSLNEKTYEYQNRMITEKKYKKILNFNELHNKLMLHNRILFYDKIRCMKAKKKGRLLKAMKRLHLKNCKCCDDVILIKKGDTQRCETCYNCFI